MIEWNKEYKILLIFVFIYVLFYFLPAGTERFDNAVVESFQLAKSYAREHVITCLIPAFFIAGAIGVFINQASVMKYLGPKANKILSYSVASVSGSILSVCSCTVLPMFAGIYRVGAGLGPAVAFLYSGPAINVLAIILTARILGWKLGMARVIGAVLFSIIIGLLMHFIFRKEESRRFEKQAVLPEQDTSRPLWQTVLYFFVMIGILVFANWSKPVNSSGIWEMIFNIKWHLTSLFAIVLGIMLFFWFRISWIKVLIVGLVTLITYIIFPANPVMPFIIGIIGLSIATASDKGEAGEWFSSTWGFAKQILPLLFMGVLIAGLFLGRPGEEALIPSEFIGNLVGGNSIWSNLFASVAGAFMYFATLTEVPILQGLLGSGMGQGPALALLLAGPALSLPSMLVIRSIIGTKKTVVYCTLVILMATASGLIYGYLIS